MKGVKAIDEGENTFYESFTSVVTQASQSDTACDMGIFIGVAPGASKRTFARYFDG
jgi:hypothetical protein